MSDKTRRLRPPRWLRQSLARRPALRAVLANSGWLMIDRMVRMLLAVFVGAWVARYLGPAAYGEFAYVIAVVALWQAVASLGLEPLIVRDLSRQRAASGEVIGTALAMRLAAATISWFGAAASLLILRPGDPIAVAMAGLLGAGLMFQTADIVDQWFQSQVRSRSTIAPRMAAYLGAALLKVVLILLHAPLWTFAVAVLCDAVFAALALAWAFRRDRLAPANFEIDWAAASRLLAEAWPLLVAGLSVAVYMRIDLFILRSLANEHELGLYSAILPISQAWHVLPITVCASVLPRLSILRETDPDAYMHRMQQLFSCMVWSAIAIAVLTTALAPWIVSLLLGPAYMEAVPVLRLHALTNIFVFLGVAQSVAIVGDRTPRIALYRTLVGAAVSATASILLVPQWGALGAAASAIASQAAAAVLSNAVLAPTYLAMQARCLWPFASGLSRTQTKTEP